MFARQHIASAAFILLAAIPRSARGFEPRTYDLDSLVFISNAIVEAKVDRVYTMPGREWDSRAQVTVTTVVAGKRAAGDSLELIFDPPEPIQAGDRVWLFLSNFKNENRVFKDFSPNTVITVSSGVKLAAKGKVLTERHGGHLEATKEDPTVENFQKQLSDSLKFVAVLKEKLAKAPAAGDVAWILPVLNARPSASEPYYLSADYIAEILSGRLANLHDPAALDEANRYSLDEPSHEMLARGFADPGARAYLMEKLRDKNLKGEERLRYLPLVEAAGPNYAASMWNVPEKSTVNSWKETQGRALRNGDYLVHLAQLAADPQTSPRLSAGLTGVFEAFSERLSDPAPEPLRTDFLAAMGELSKIAARSDSPKVQYQINVVARALGVAKKYGMHDGIIVGRAQCVSISKDPHGSPVVQVFFEFHYFSNQSTDTFTFQAILHPVAGRKDVVIDLPEHTVVPPHQLPPYTATTSEDHIRLPGGLAPGAYHLFYRIFDNGVGIEDSRGFDFSWPPPSNPATTTTRSKPL